MLSPQALPTRLPTALSTADVDGWQGSGSNRLGGWLRRGDLGRSGLSPHVIIRPLCVMYDRRLHDCLLHDRLLHDRLAA